MALSEKEMFDRLEIALDVYYKTNQIPPGGQIQLDLFIEWLYNQYGIVRKRSDNEKMDSI